jgi:hypothetical protein
MVKGGKMRAIVENIVRIISDKYPFLYVDYKYHKDIDVYEIWYNIDMEDNREFNRFLGGLIKKYFYSKNIYNVFIDYSYSKSKNINLYSICLNKENYQYKTNISSLIPQAA